MNLKSTEKFWEFMPEKIGELETLYGFARAYTFGRKFDLSLQANKLPEGIALCSPNCIAGPEHVRRILFQASRYWGRGQSLARNKSLDLLMRITCQSQIFKAIQLSGISEISKVAIFGLAKSPNVFEKSISILKDLIGNMQRNDVLLSLAPKKGKLLRDLHHFPRRCTDKQLLTYLQEKSVLLVFDK